MTDNPKQQLSVLKQNKPGWWHVYTAVMDYHKASSGVKA
jgi:hypothetical protein